MRKLIEKIIVRKLEAILRRSEVIPPKWRHVADTDNGTLFHLDDRYRIWSCDCQQPAESRVSLCITIDDVLESEGELRKIKREIAIKRKELGLLHTDK